VQLRHLEIHRFRGIRHLDWTPQGRVIALVGAGDSTKTTIVDAVGFLASPRIGITFTDTDFFEGDASSGFRLEGTISELPRALLADDRLGLELRGIDDDGTIHDEPGDFEPAVTIRLDVNDSLESTWSVITDRNPDGRPLSVRDRALLGVSRVGDNPDRQFTWARGSALARLTASTDQLQQVIAAAYRQARDAVAAADLGELDDAIERAQLAAAQLGAGPATEDMEVRLDASPNASGALGLHHEGIPLGSAGLGTRRLLALGLELVGTPDGAILAIDEIEHGLEPHRLRHLLRVLRRKVAGDGAGHGQVLFTTHSPVVLEELEPNEIAVVHASAGDIAARSIPDDLAAIVRSTPEAFLSRRVLVCEGKTEIGVILGHDEVWSSRHDSRSLAHLGVVTAFGSGTETGRRAQAFVDLSYSVAVLADSDASFEPNHDALTALGVLVARWDGDCAIEERAASDLSWDSLGALFDALVGEGYEPGQLVDTMQATPTGATACARAGVDRPALGDGLKTMVAAGLTEAEVRKCFGQTAKKKGWFKRVDLGETLGRVIARDDTIAGTDLGQKLAQVEGWCFAE
jgi:putative ATP-dependent endonuclease of OLD family